VKKPFVYIAGAGPGDASLTSVRVCELIKECDAVIYDRLIDDSLLLLCAKNTEKIYAGKAALSHSMKQEDINNLIAKKAMEGKTVLRLKGGDPFVFGRGGEEAEFLKSRGIPYEIIPAVSSCIAVPEKCGIPVTYRGLSRSFTVVTGHSACGSFEEAENYEALSRLKGTLVFLMGLENIEKITSALMLHGKAKDTPAAVISCAMTENEHIIRGTLENITKLSKNDKKIISPAIIIVGKTAALDLRCENSRPLCGIKTGVSGTKEFTTALCKRLKAEGAFVRTYDYMDVKPLENGLKTELENMAKYSHIAFTSANGVRLFFDDMKKYGFDIRTLCGCRIAVIGDGTRRELEKYMLKADMEPESFTSEALGHLLAKNAAAGRVLIPRAENGSRVLSEILTENKVDFKEIYLYKTVFNCESVLDTDGLDFFAFASASSVSEFFEHGGKLNKAKAVAIGPVTAEKLRQYGVEALISQKASAEEMAATIIKEVQNK